MRAIGKAGLWRNWKGYLVWREPCRNADSGDGYTILILTGPRAGEREWRSVRSWSKSPAVAPGLPRYEPVPDPIPWCPITQAISVFHECYPETALVPVLWDPGHDTPGACYYRAGKPLAILLDPDMTLTEAAGVVLHELAHVVVTPEQEQESHGPMFKTVETRLRVAYEERLALKLQIPGIVWREAKNDL